jgi:CARDB
LSFFDDVDEPRTEARPPRRPSPSGRRPPPIDPQTLMIRRAVAAGVAVVAVILLVVIVKGCVDSQAKDALKTYDRNVARIAKASDDEVKTPLFNLLTHTAGKQPQDVNTQINQYKVAADNHIKQAEGINVPDEVVEAQRDFLLALELRRDAVARIAAQIQTAMSRTGAASGAVAKIAGQNQAFLASAVVFSQQAQPLIVSALDKKGIAVGGTGEPLPQMGSVPDLGWLRSDFVAAALNATSTSSSSSNSGPIKPGTHGHALISTAVGSTTLQAGSPARIPASPPPVFKVTIQNQGQNDETNVKVQVRVSGSGPPITATKTIPKTTAGQQSSVNVELPKPPPRGAVVTVRVSVEPVRGEKTTTNNSQSYQVLFTG